jgi:hypothetical protein
VNAHVVTFKRGEKRVLKKLGEFETAFGVAVKR